MITTTVEDAPRHLTEVEIERVLAAIPAPHAITEDHAELARAGILKVLRAELIAIQLCPSGLDDLITRVVTQFEESRVKPGAMVGLAAAEANNNKIQQANLSAVHKAGQAGMRGAGGAVGRLGDLVTKQQSKAASEYDACSVFFNEIQTQHSILHDKRPDMIALNLLGLLQPDHPFIIEYHTVLFPEKKLPDWYQVYSQVYGVPLPDLGQRENAKLLRLNMDLEKVVEYRVMVSDIRRALLASNSRVARFYVSPLKMGIIDIWALDEEIHSYGHDHSGDPELDAFNFLFGFASRLNLFFVKGIPGIRDVQPVKFDLWPLMTFRQSHRHLRDNVYEYRLSSMWPMRFGWERARMLWKFLDITVVDFDESPDASWVVLDGGDKGPPHEIIRSRVDADKADALAYQRSAVAAGKQIVTRPVTPENVLFWSEVWYARTDGTNLREIMVRDDVDQRFTISNKPFEVLEIYGIVAARRVMLEELYLAYDSSGRENPEFSVRHFSMLADFVCHTGVVRPISNLLIQARSTLSKSTFSRQFNTLVAPAIHGVDEPIGDVSAAIMVAARAKIGPRAFEYEGVINEGVTAEEIKTKLRSGSRSGAELDKIIASLVETTDAPLYVTGVEGEASAREAAVYGRGDEAEELDAEEELYEATILPPGVPDEEGGDEPARLQQRRVADFLLIEDDDDDVVEFSSGLPAAATAEEQEDPPPRTSRRSKAGPVASRKVVMSPALEQAIKNIGGTVSAEPTTTRRPPPEPVCGGSSLQEAEPTSSRAPVAAGGRKKKATIVV